MKPLKIALLGGGSAYFETVLTELSLTPELHGSEIVLFDIDRARVEVMERLGKRIVRHLKARMKVSSTLDRKRALDGTDYAIASIGVHGPAYRWHKSDSDTAARHGIIHTTGDTTGPGGLSQGLRIIPIFLEIVREMERLCPDAVLLNHSNPMAPICRAVRKYSRIRCIGYCHNVAGGIHYFAKVLDVAPEDLDVVVAGVNHMVWLLSITCRGRDAYPELRSRLEKTEPPPTRKFSQQLFEMMGLYPIGGDRHIIEFFPHARRATETGNIPYGLQWRSDMIRKNIVVDEIAHKAGKLQRRAAGKEPLKIPERMSPETMGIQVKTLRYGPGRIHVVNIPNEGAIDNLPAWAVVEIKAVLGPDGARPISVGTLPPQAARWTLAQIYAHELTVEAAAEGSRSKAIQALASDPMIRDFEEAEKVFDALVKSQGPRLARFR